MFRVGSIDSIEGLPPRRIPVSQSGLRSLIGAPITETFAKMSPTATAFHARKKVPDAMLSLRQFDNTFFDEKPSQAGDVLPSAIIPALVVQNISTPSLTTTSAPYGFGRASYIRRRSDSLDSPGITGNSDRRGNAFPERPTFAQPRQGKRVTLAYDGLQAPVLNIRFSAQLLPEVGKLISGIGRNSPSPSTDNPPAENSRNQRAVVSRPRSSPPVTVGSRPALGSRAKEAEIGVAITTVGTSVVDASTASKASEQLLAGRAANGGSRGRSHSTSYKPAQIATYNPFADNSNVDQPSSGSPETSLKKTQATGGDSSLSDDSLNAIRQLSTQFPPLPPRSRPSPTGEILNKNLLRKASPFDSSDSVVIETVPSARQRSYSSPSLQSPRRGRVAGRAEMSSPRKNKNDTSPRISLDQDVAIRTKRRINTHLKKASLTPVGGLGEAQWAGSQVRRGPYVNQSASSSPNGTTAISTATSLFSTRGRGTHSVYIKSTGGGRVDMAEDMLTSPITAFSTDSIYSTDNRLSTLQADRPVGRLAQRVLGIEQFLGEEREKYEASQDGHSEPIMASTSTQPSSMATIPFNAPRSQPPTTFPASRVRPRSNIDATPSAPRPPKRSMTVDDPDAREAFAAAWRTVVPNVATPSVADLKTVSSVRVKKTPAPSRHRAMFSGESMQSMRVDEVPGPSSPRPATRRRLSQRSAVGNNAGRLTESTENDGESVKKARSLKMSSVDSKVY